LNINFHSEKHSSFINLFILIGIAIWQALYSKIVMQSNGWHQSLKMLSHFCCYNFVKISQRCHGDSCARQKCCSLSYDNADVLKLRVLFKFTGKLFISSAWNAWVLQNKRAAISNFVDRFHAFYFPLSENSSQHDFFFK